MRRQRLVVGAAGVLLGLYGVIRLVTDNSPRDLFLLVVWMLAAVAVHDGVLSPAVLAVGRLLTAVPARARRWVQLVLVIGALVTAVAVPLLYRQGSQPESKALLVNDYGDRLAVLLAVVGAAGLLGYAVQVARTAGHARPGQPVDSRTTRS
jgi:divalent metal cation (Fe/Co/Zn/Cd) transporter